VGLKLNKSHAIAKTSNTTLESIKQKYRLLYSQILEKIGLLWQSQVDGS